MNCNIGKIDKIIRIMLGIGLIALIFVGPRTAWGWLGVIPLVTALVGWCPVYRLLGISSFSKDLTRKLLH